MLKRITVATAALIVVSGTAAAADPRITPDEDNPGVDLIITEPGAPGGSGGGGEGSLPIAGGGGGGPSVPSPRDRLEDLCNDVGTVPVCIDPPEPGDPAPEDPVDAGPVDAAQVAASLRGRLDLPTPRINTSPSAPVKALVGLETWLWVDQAQWQPVTLDRALGETRVTVTATPMQSRWDMGEGATNCAGPGRAWRKGLGQNAQTSCGYTYRQTSVREPEDKYQISAVLRYRIEWTCEGNCSAPSGELDALDTVPSTAALEVSERQSVVIR